jgi:5-methylthioadenosine/S-adenosylhomocysteine deaminase
VTADRTVIANGYVLSMDAGIGEVEHGSVLIEGSRIVAVERDLGSVDAEVIDAAGAVIHARLH